MPRAIDLDVEPDALFRDSDEELLFSGDDVADRATDAVVRNFERLGLRSIAIGGRPRKPDAYLNEEDL
jgi:hypothetical protein